jgi:hypothetical protein
MIDGIVLGVAMLAASTSGSAALADRHAAVPVGFTVERSASTVPLRNPAHPRLDEQSRPIWRAATFSSSQASAPKRFTKTDRVIAVVAGIAGGWLAGGAIGYYSTANWDNPDDDTSGLKGMIIGAPIGGAVGGILGYWLTNR